MINDIKFNGKKLKQPLTSEQLDSYLNLIKNNNDAKAKEIVLEHNMRLVVKTINLFYPNYPTTYEEDLFSEGCIGLYKAIEDFDPSLGYEFSTYAIHKIRGVISYFVRNNNLMHIPVTLIELANTIKRTQVKYAKENNNSLPSIATLSKILKVPKEEITLAMGCHNTVLSLSSPIHENTKDGKNLRIEDTLSNDYNTIEPEEEINNKQQCDGLIKTLDKLTEQEKQVIKLFYGIDGEKKQLAEIERILNISRHMVLKHRDTALDKLKDMLPDYIQDEYRNAKPIPSNHKTQSPNDLYALFPDYTEEQVLKTIKFLNKRNKKFIELRFGLNGKESINVKEIAEMFNTTASKVHSSIIGAKKRIKTLLEYQCSLNIPKQNIQIRTKNIFEYFKGYKEEDVLDAINLLKDSDKKIIEMAFGLNNNEFFEYKEISEILNIKGSTLRNRIKDIKVKIRNTLNNQVQESLINSFENHKDDIKNLIDSLDSIIEKTTLLLRLGFVRNKSYSEDEIANLLNKSKEEIHEIINNSLKNISKLPNMNMQHVTELKHQLYLTK